MRKHALKCFRSRRSLLTFSLLSGNIRFLLARVAKLVDAPASGAGGFTAVKVRVLSRAPNTYPVPYQAVRDFFLFKAFALRVSLFTEGENPSIRDFSG